MTVPTAATSTRPGSWNVSERATRRIGYALLAALAYVPVLLSDPGKVAADTKQYLYLDPARLLERAVSMWDPHIGMGTVTHQNIGYVFPMGPFYWFFDTIGVPDWVAQRLWLGSILFFAGLGVLYLLRTLHVHGPGAPAAAVVFMLSPYSLDYAARISVILLPFAALPWLLALTIRALRDGRWRYPAAFAVVVQVVGGVNATALIFAGIAPVLWIPYSVWVSREIRFRRALITTLKIGGLTILLSLWWIAGLSIQAGFGLDVLKYTETVKTVSTASIAPEVFRGLGYWFFYGTDKIGPWIESSVQYTQWVWLIGVGYAIPVLGLLAAAFTRWRHRIYFAVLLFVGVAIAVGAHPYDDPSPFGGVLKSFAAQSSAGLALRSTGRAVPLVALSMAVFLAIGISAATRWWQTRAAGRERSRWWSRAALLPAAVVVILALVNLPALFNGTFYGKNLERPEEIPNYWREAAAAMDAQPHDTRVLTLPGADFASYRWGNLVDPLLPGIMDRPFVARELIPWGSPGTADLLNAFDRRVQEGVMDPDAIAPVSRLMAAGDVLLRNDLQVDRYNLVRPVPLALLFTPTPSGLRPPLTFGTSLGPPLTFPLEDELALGLPPNLPDPPPVVVYPVRAPVPIVRTQRAAAPLVMAGDGEGVMTAASVGLVTRDGLLLYSASDAKDPAALRAEIERGATLVVTDSNRKRARRWSTVRDNVGYTERAGEMPLETDPSDAQLDLFPDAGPDAYTTAEQRGGATISASAYGNPVAYTPEDRAVRAMDGDLQTAWRVAAFSPATGKWLRITFDHPMTTDHVNLVQPLTGPRDRYITKATLKFSDHGKVTTEPITFDHSSRTATGQTFHFSRRTFDRLEIHIDADNVGSRADYIGVSAVGFAEIRVQSDTAAHPVTIREVVTMPTDLTKVAGPASIERRFVVLMERERVLPVPPRTDPELQFIRQFSIPTARTFGVGGVARLDADAPSPLLDTLLGAPSRAEGGYTVTASSTLPGAILARPSQAIDGDPTTAWQSAFGPQAGAFINVATPAPVTFDHLALQVMADGRHSVPTELTVSAGGETRTVAVPAVPDQTRQNATVAVSTAAFPALTGSDIRVEVTKVREVKTKDYYTGFPVTAPVGIAELGIPGVQRAPLPAQIPSSCRRDLLEIDGKPVPVRVSGSRTDAETRQPLDVALCGTPPSLDAGTHQLDSAIGRDVGIDLDTLTLASEAGGGALIPGPDGAVTPAPPASGASAPRLRVTESGSTDITATVDRVRGPFELVLGESDNAGWRARIDGRDLGPSRLVNGYANGWSVPDLGAGSHRVELVWTPQNRVWWSLILSALGMVACLAIIALSLLRRRAALPAEAPAVDAPPVLEAPWRRRAGRVTPRPLTVVVTAIGVGLVGAAFIRPGVGIALAALAIAGLVRPRLRTIAALGAPVALALAGGYIALQQWRYRYPPHFEWPTFFDTVQVLGWLAAALIALDAVLEYLDRHEPPSPEGEDA